MRLEAADLPEPASDRDSAPFPVIRVAPDGFILYANPASGPVLAAWHSQVGDRLPENWRNHVGKAIESGLPVCREMVCDTWAMDLTFLAAKHGAGVDVYGKDITERKQNEGRIASQLEELQRWQDVMLGREDRVRELKREVNEALARLDQPPRYGSVVEEGGTVNVEGEGGAQ